MSISHEVLLIGSVSVGLGLAGFIVFCLAAYIQGLSAKKY